METLKEKILVIQTAFIGDAILTLPMLQELKHRNPNSEIDVIAIDSTASVFSSSPAVNEVIILEKRGAHKSVFGLLKFCRSVREKNYSRIYSPHRSFRTAFIVMQSGVRETYGFTNSSMLHVYKHLVEYNYEDHEVKRNLNLIGAETSGDLWKIAPLINTSGEIKSTVINFLQQNKLNSFIALAPGSIWNTKVYPTEYYKEIASHLVSRGEKILILGGEKDVELCNKLSDINPVEIISCAGKFNIIEVIELLKYAKLLVCNDSAPTHMGQAACIPVLTLYCSTNAAIGFYPYNVKSSYLSYDDLYCKPCGIHGRTECPVKTFECGFNLKPAIVIKKIEELLNDKIH